MLKVRICRVDGAVIAAGTCSDSGYSPWPFRASTTPSSISGPRGLP
jgi:hypothetical protein